VAVRNLHQLTRVSGSSVQGYSGQSDKEKFPEGSSDWGIVYKGCQEFVI